MLHPERSSSLTDIAAAVGTSVPTVMREVNRLADAGLVRQLRRGNIRLVGAHTENAVFATLAQLMAVTYGPIPVLRERLGAVDGVREACIYGSWAAKYAEQPGRVPEDIDVLVIGTTDLEVSDDVAARAGSRLGREVNVRRVRPTVWDTDDDDPFKATVKARPLVTHQLGRSGQVIRLFGRLRRTRNEADYPRLDTPNIKPEDVVDDLVKARDTVSAMESHLRILIRGDSATGAVDRSGRRVGRGPKR